MSSAAGSNVEVTLKAVGKAARLSVRDHGCGIPGGEQAKIFQEFYRVDNDDSQSAAGAGLGLALVKRTIQAHAGSVRVESAVGMGSRRKLGDDASAPRLIETVYGHGYRLGGAFPKYGR